VLLAQAIKKKELSAQAQLALCRGVLSKPRGIQSEDQTDRKPPTEAVGVRGRVP